MAMTREAWTDERLDDLNGHVNSGFRRVDQDIRDLRTEMSDLRTEMNRRFDETHRLIVQVGGGMFATMVVGFASILVTLH
jgi:hypothetical protein